MKIVIDNGGTKLDWGIVGKNQYFSAKGINVFNSKNIIISQIRDIISEDILNNKDLSIDFYTAGFNSVIESKFNQIFDSCFPGVEIKLFSDLLGASRALFQKKPGISCILGTGSNCAYFDGVKNHQITPSLGYIFGDEGSGYHLGKKLLIKYLNNELSNELNQALEDETQLTKNELIEFIYSSKNHKPYIASFSIFIKRHESYDEIDEIIKESISGFLDLHPFQYPNFHVLKFGFSGSVAFNFKRHLEHIMKQKNINCIIIQKPIEHLINSCQK